MASLVQDTSREVVGDVEEADAKDEKDDVTMAGFDDEDDEDDDDDDMEEEDEEEDDKKKQVEKDKEESRPEDFLAEPPNSMKGLVACRACALVKTFDQFYENDCDNCDIMGDDRNARIRVTTTP
jgi:hypothetical protein|tara:strand:- start:92 stop:463 length:372 start_codon:yes stop_codon:yes gene_type:complete